MNTPVRIIYEPVKIGWQGDALVLEAHPVLASAPGKTTDEPLPDETVSAAAMPDAPVEVVENLAAEIVEDPPIEKNPLTFVTEQFVAATAERAGELDWSLVEVVISRSDGMPVAVGAGTKNAATSAAC